MEIPRAVIFLGALIFLSHIFNALFSKIKVPNVLLLLLIGIIVGPITGLVDYASFKEVGPVFTSITLIIILFESGVNLKLKEVFGAIGSASILTVFNFLVGAAIAAVGSKFLAGLSWVEASFFGVIVAGTSSAVVIPMIKQLQMKERSRTLLSLESALSDVLCLVIGLALFEAMRQGGTVEVGVIGNKIWQAFLFALLAGIGAALLWSVILRLLRNVKNSMFTTFAFVFIVYGAVESFGLNGGIACLAFGITLGNCEMFNTRFFKKIFAFELAGLKESEKDFFSEFVFVVQTYFFVYVGINIQFGNAFTYLIGGVIVIVIIMARPLGIRAFVRGNTPFKDLAIMSVMTPKGLVPAILASLPLQYGLANAEKIQDLGYSVVLFSIVICSILVIILSKNAAAVKPISNLFEKQQTREAEEEAQAVADEAAVFDNQAHDQDSSAPDIDSSKWLSDLDEEEPKEG